jgi:creatinine amidohydrolase/Fe(II)-dependent formamide hydrolase-like protein
VPQPDSTIAAGALPWRHTRLNDGPWITAYTWTALASLASQEALTLPIISIHDDPGRLHRLGTRLLPPLFREAMDDDLRRAIITRIDECLPYFHTTSHRAAASARVQVVESPNHPAPGPATRPRVLAICIDTAVEQHGPHLPLATDRIQSLTVLDALARQTPDLHIAPPLDYGQLAWGLPIGWSVDLTAPLTTRYVTGYVNALLDAFQPQAIYAVCVHGSRFHHEAIRAGLQQSRAQRWVFRWLHEPLSPQAWSRGDAHAGGVETALIEHINPALLDPRWWPARRAELQQRQMTLAQAIERSANLPAFILQDHRRTWNGIVGDLANYDTLNPAAMMALMLDTARRDLGDLL